MSGDTFITSKAGAVGPYSTAINTSFVETAPTAEGIDLAVLADELSRLKVVMKDGADGTRHLESVVAVSSAEDAARNGDSATTMAKLRTAGTWAWDTATKIGVSVAAEAIKRSLGLS